MPAISFGTETILQALSNQQRLHLVNTQQLYENHIAAYRHARDHAYGMRWKTIRDVEYLFRERDRRGNGKLLGRRSPETEQLLSAFLAGKARAQERLAAIRLQLDEQARLNKALRLGRVPRVVARILRELEEHGVGNAFTVMGTQAMYGYEAAGGVQFLLELLASGDVDLLYDARKKITLVSSRLDGEGLLGLLKKADRTFELVRKRGFRAANAGQFMVDFIVAPRSMRESEAITFSSDDLVASEVPGLQWLINSPKLETVAVDEDGQAVPFRVPDPRAFALHKAWLSQQLTREPLKKPRDLAQARVVAQLVREHMPHLAFAGALTSLHGDVRAMSELLGIQS
jgi:hypothetical protein